MPLFDVRRAAGAGYSNGGSPAARLTTMGELVVVDFLTAAILDGRGFQVRAGTITTPLTGDIEITDTAAEMAVDAASATTIIPVHLNVDVESVNGGTLPTVAAKSVATVSSAGTAFVPLLLKSNGSAAVTTARVQAAGAVTVTAELATTTLRHYSQTLAAVGNFKLADYEFATRPVLVGPRCFYVQIAGTTAGPTYFAEFDYLEFPTLLVDPS